MQICKADTHARGRCLQARKPSVLQACVSLEGEAGIRVGCEDFLDGVCIGGCSEVKAEVELVSSLHDSPSRALHGVIKTGVYNILFGGTRDTFLEGFRWGHGDATADAAETSLQ